MNNPNDELTDVPIVTAATAYDAPNGETYILVIAQAIYLGNHIDKPATNQLQCNGIIVDDVPKHLSPDPHVATHSTFIPDAEVSILLYLKGVFFSLLDNTHYSRT